MKLRKILACMACAVMTMATFTVPTMAGQTKEIDVTITPPSWGGGATAFTNVGYIDDNSANLKLTLKSIEVEGVEYIFTDANNSVDLAEGDNSFPNAWDGVVTDGLVVAESADGAVIKFKSADNSFYVYNTSGSTVTFYSAKFVFDIAEADAGTYTFHVQTNTWNTEAIDFEITSAITPEEDPTASTDEETTASTDEETTASPEDETTVEDNGTQGGSDEPLGDNVWVALVLAAGVVAVITGAGMVCRKKTEN